MDKFLIGVKEIPKSALFNPPRDSYDLVCFPNTVSIMVSLVLNSTEDIGIIPNANLNLFPIGNPINRCERPALFPLDLY